MHPRISYIFGSSRKVGGANKGLGEAPKSCTRKEHESATNSIAQRGQGGDFVPFRLPLAGSRDSVPCGVWGNAPTVPRATSIANALNKGAGSEASLPLTLRVRRRAPKLLFPQDSMKNLIHCSFPYIPTICPITSSPALPSRSSTTAAFQPNALCSNTRKSAAMASTSAVSSGCS